MLKRKKKVIAKVMATTMLASTLAMTFAPSASAAGTTVSSSTIAGNNRYETAVKISEAGWSSSNNAVLINGESGLVDALTATPYAGLKNAPILVTHKDKLTPVTKDRLIKMGVKNVDIVGGTAVVSDEVVKELKAMGITVNRIAGTSRYKTSLAVAEAMDKISDVSQVAVVNGATGLPDAISVAAPAAYKKMPIILSNPNEGIKDSKAFIDGESIYRSYVIGEVGAVSDSIMNSLPGTKVRLGGARRQETNAKVIKEFYPNSSLNNIYVAKSGLVQRPDELVDALAVGVLAAKEDVPVMIVGNSLDPAQQSLLASKKFSRITQVGNGIPTSSIDAIKATQADVESKVTSVSMVNYKTIKLYGSDLNKLSASNIYMSGNSVRSYTTNSSGTEATVEFNNAFNNGTNTVRVTSNLGNSSNYNFTYNSEVSSVQATTKEVASKGIQYLDFTVNGSQKRSIEELKALGWTVKFESKSSVFYNEDNPAAAATTTSKSGKLMTSGTLPAEFVYEVILTKGNTTLRSEKQVVTVKAESTLVKEIKSYDRQFTGNRAGLDFEGSKLLVGESIEIANLKVLKQNGQEQTLANSADILGEKVEITSSNPTVLTVNGTNIKAGAEGSATITIKAGNVSKQFSVNVLKASTNVRTPQSVRFYLGNSAVSSVNMVSGNKEQKVKVKVIDQHGDPIKPGDSKDPNFTIKGLIETTANPAVPVAEVVSTTPEFNSKGEADITIKSLGEDITGTGVLRIQKKDANGTVKDISTLNVAVSKESTNKTYRMDIPVGKDYNLDKYYPKQDLTKKDDELIVTVNELSSNGYIIGAKDISDKDKYTIEVTNSNGTVNDTIVKAEKGPDQGTIKINTVKNDVTGSATIRLYENTAANGVNRKTQIGSNIYVNVKDSTPTIADIKINQPSAITKFTTDKSPEFKLEDLFDITYTRIDPNDTSDNKNDEARFKKVISGVRLNGHATDEVLISINSTNKDLAEATIFIDESGDGQITTTGSTPDLILGTVNIELSNIVEAATPRTDYSKISLENSQKGKVGYIIARLYHGEYSESKTPFRNINVEVNIPNN